MIWLTWRQFRVPAIVAVTALAVAAILLASTNPGGGYFSHDHLLAFLSTFLVGVPALIGAFWGVPLVASELESGTHRLVWTQSVTRTRWLAVKVSLIGAASVAVTGAFSLMLGAWSSAAVNQDRFGPPMFGQRGIVPIGYAAFGFCSGVFLGLLIRRNLPAMATTLVAFVATRMVVQSWVRPHFATPLKLSEALTAANGSPLHAKPGAWVVSNNFFDAAGHVINNIPCGGGDAQACMAQFHQILTYQPASRYWAFQSYETATFACLSLILIGLSFWWIRSRTS
jgi:hypothetical protein